MECGEEHLVDTVASASVGWSHGPRDAASNAPCTYSPEHPHAAFVFPAMSQTPSTHVAPILLSTASSPRVWIPTVSLVAVCAAFYSVFLTMSPTTGYCARVPFYATWSGLAAIPALLAGVGWLRKCSPRLAVLACRTCGYDLRGAPALRSACPECGSTLRQTEAPATRGKPRAFAISSPGVLLIVGAVACAGHAVLLVLLLAMGACA